MIRVALVGTGSIAASGHVPALRAQAHRAQLVAVVDIDRARAESFQAAHGVPAAYTDLEQMLAEVRPDLVHLCTPPFAHAQQAMACLKAGAWVWCEKPICLSLAEYDSIVSQESDGGPYASVVSQHRFGSGARYLRTRANSGKLGRALVAQCVTAWYRDQAYFEIPWRGRWETEGGGPTMGHGIHQMDLMLSILGDWTEVRAMMGTLDRHVETEDVSMALVRFANGAMASVVNSVLSRREESYLRFDYAAATVELRHLYGYSNSDWNCTPPDLWRPPEDLPSSHETQLGLLLDSIDDGRPPPLQGDSGRQALELITGIYASAIMGKPVARTELTPNHPFYHRLNGGQAL